jgi:glycosyltransferase involved in cell wall biosynthesis
MNNIKNNKKKKNKRLPLVSIIVMTRECEKTIETCLKSLLAQTYENKEIILVDNFSKDKTVEIASKYIDRIYLKGPERSAQMDFGLSVTNGKYIFFAAGDFYFQKEYIKKCVKKSEEENCDAVYLTTLGSGTGFWEKVRVLERKVFSFDDTLESAYFFKRDSYIKLGGYDTDLVAGEDYDIQHRLNSQGYKTGRVDIANIHLREDKNLKEIFRKSFYYGQHFRKYLKKHRMHGIKQLNPFRKAIFRNYKLFLENPLYTLGYIIYKIVQYSGGFLGLLYSFIKRNNQKKD